MQVDPTILGLGLAFVVSVVGLLWPQLENPCDEEPCQHHGHYPRCPYKNGLGVDCPYCSNGGYKA